MPHSSPFLTLIGSEYQIETFKYWATIIEKENASGALKVFVLQWKGVLLSVKSQKKLDNCWGFNEQLFTDLWKLTPQFAKITIAKLLIPVLSDSLFPIGSLSFYISR